MSDLKDKVVLVTGSSAGIGEGIAIHLAGLGAKLTLTGRDENNLDRVAGLCKSAGSDDSKIICVAGDIRSQAVRESMISKTVERFWRLDVLVNNAGLIYAGSGTTATEEQYDEILNVNVKSVFFLTKLAIPHLKENKGNIINISSNAGSSPVKDYSPYCMSKAAIDMYTKCLSLELASCGVRVNAVCPGLTDSRIFRRPGSLLSRRKRSKIPGLIETRILRRPGSPFVEEEAFQNFMREFAEKIPVGRYGQPIEIARAVAFLASDEQASFITGETMNIDGAHRFTLN